jgi:glutamyl-tRNA reductase
MEISVLGVDFRSASIDIRQTLAFNQEEISNKLLELKKTRGLLEVVILSTCNRTEIYLVTEDYFDFSIITTWWVDQSSSAQPSYASAIYHKVDSHVVEHLFNVSCGLESMVLGEPQILGQIKKSFAMAKLAGTTSRILYRLFDHAFNVAKKVRTQTGVGRCPVSIGNSAIMLAKEKISDFSDKSILIIGAGDTAELIAKHIVSLMPKNICIANRTLNKAKILADKVSADYTDLRSLSDDICKADIVISAININKPIISLDVLKGVFTKKRLFIDLSVPRSISNNIEFDDSSELVCVDDIQLIIKKSTQSRLESTVVAESFIEEAINNYSLSVKADYADGAICNIRKHVDDVVLSEFEQSIKLLQNGEDPVNVLMRFSHRIKNKWLHYPCVTMKKASQDNRDDILEVAHDFFGLGGVK